MNRKIVKLTTITLTLMIVLSSAIVFQVNAQPRPQLYVDPAEKTLSTSTTSVGATFDVSVKSADFVDPGVYSYEFRLYYDKSMLEATAAVIPDGHWLTPALSPGNIFKVDPGTINTAEGFVSFAATMLGAEPGKTGGGIIATITLKITAEPPAGPGSALTSNITLSAVTLVDPSASEIPSSSYDKFPCVFTYARPEPTKPYLSVSSQTWDNPTADAAGRLFNITVSMNDLVEDWHVVGIDFRLGFDDTLLTTQAAWIFNGTFLQQFGEVFMTAYVEDKAIVGQLQLPPWPGPNGWAHGSGAIAIIQFSALPVLEGECALTLSDVHIVDSETNVVAYSKLEAGTYTLTIAPAPWLSLAPRQVTLEKLGDSFNVNVVINSLDSRFQMVGTEFKIFYNTTVLETTADKITEGVDNIMREVATRSGTDLFFQTYLEEDHGLVGIILLPLPDGTWPFFPEGTGVLAAVEFTAILQLQNSDLTTIVNVGDILLVDVNAKEVPLNLQKTEEEGTCTVTIKQAFAPPPAERMIDLYTQYATPYGGQGLNAPSDAFAPQGQVQLFAKVTYRGDSIPNKPVAYQIIGPNGYEFSAIAFTNANGLALLDFSMPASSTYFGIWSISSSVDVAGKVVTDTLIFRFGWLVEVKSITITPNDGIINVGEELQKLIKGKTYTMTVTLKIITMQHPVDCVQLEGIEAKTLISYSGFDELKQPLFNKFVDLTTSIGPNWLTVPTAADMNDFVTNSAGREVSAGSISIAIPSSAYSGIGNIYVNIYTDYPWVSGVPYSDPKIGAKQVWIEAPPSAEPTIVQVSTTAALKASSQTWTEDAANKAGRKFTITISLENVRSDEHITAIEFKLTYDTSLLQVVDATEGPFVKQFGDSSIDPKTFFVWYVEADGVIAGELQLPPYPGDNGWMAGSGTLCTFSFNAIGHAPPIRSCVLGLKNTLMSDADANPIQFKYLVNGYYVITP